MAKMSMPDEISKMVHNFLRGDFKKRIYTAKQKWIEKNSLNGFKLGELYTKPFQNHNIYKVVKVGAMVTFECDGELFRRKPKFIKEKLCYYDGMPGKWYDEPAHWEVDLPIGRDKLKIGSDNVHFLLQTVFWRDS